MVTITKLLDWGYTFPVTEACWLYWQEWLWTQAKEDFLKSGKWSRRDWISIFSNVYNVSIVFDFCFYFPSLGNEKWSPHHFWQLIDIGRQDADYNHYGDKNGCGGLYPSQKIKQEKNYYGEPHPQSVRNIHRTVKKEGSWLNFTLQLGQRSSTFGKPIKA